jgi:hypothetical protein
MYNWFTESFDTMLGDIYDWFTSLPEGDSAVRRLRNSWTSTK